MFKNRLINHLSNILCKLWSIINWITLPRPRLLHGIMDMPRGYARHMMSCSIVALICIQKLLRHQLCAIGDGLLVSHFTFVCWINGFINWGIGLYCCWMVMPKCKAMWSSQTRFFIVYVVEWCCQNECISSMFTKVYCLITHDADQSPRPRNHNMNNGKFSHKWNWMTCLLITGLSPKMELGGCVELVRGGGEERTRKECDDAWNNSSNL